MRIRKANRLKSFDYSKDGTYFVTFCIKDKEPYFGKVVNYEMVHSIFGQIVIESVAWLQAQYSYIEIHGCVVMPDHVHILIEINRPNNVVTGRDLSLPDVPKIKSISELVGALKTVSSKNIRLNGCPEFEWQRSFYDQIIKSPQHFEVVCQHIVDNPKRWKK